MYFLMGNLQWLCLHKQAANSDQHHRNNKGQEHDLHKFQIGNIELGVKVQILGVTKGGQHTAQVGGNILHNEGKGHILSFAGGSQHQGAQGQKGQQRHIVGD